MVRPQAGDWLEERRSKGVAGGREGFNGRPLHDSLAPRRACLGSLARAVQAQAQQRGGR